MKFINQLAIVWNAVFAGEMGPYDEALERGYVCSPAYKTIPH